MVRLAGLAIAAAVLIAPFDSRAACPKNPAKPKTVEGVKVKAGSCGPYMMHAEDISNGYYDCKDTKGHDVKATYKDCDQTNAKKPGSAADAPAHKGKAKGKKNADD
jgi:hypothetical protein